MAQDIPERPDRRPWQPRREVVGLRPQLRRRLAQALEAAFDRVARRLSAANAARSMP
jgi:hypothetical protein